MARATDDRPAQTEPSGQFASPVAAALERLAAERFMERCWRKDVTLWADPAERENVAQRLGWLGIAGVMRGRVNELRAFAEEIAAAGFTHALLLGMGGSSLFPDVCRSVFGARPGGLDLTMLDTTDPTAIDQLRARVPLAKTIIMVSSKSGSTLETSSLCSYFYE